MIQIKALWLRKGQEARLFVRGARPAITLSTVGGAASMSALQQTPICGLEKPGFPNPADACQGLKRQT
jgi:hypothetical protein